MTFTAVYNVSDHHSESKVNAKEITACPSLAAEDITSALDTHKGPKLILGRARGEVGSLGDGRSPQSRSGADTSDSPQKCRHLDPLKSSVYCVMNRKRKQ